MQRSRRLAAIAVAAAGLTLVAACGSNSKATTPSGSATTPAAASLKGQHLEVIAEWSGAEQAAFQAVLNGFQTKTGASVTYTSGGDNTSVLVNTRRTSR
jgi:alpha-glucoside transport system substrate-binding protein